MPSSIWRDEAPRYAVAFHDAVIERDLAFQLGHEFADWWRTSGWTVDRTISDGYADWAGRKLPARRRGRQTVTAIPTALWWCSRTPGSRFAGRRAVVML
jgi:hypothetical protein